MQVAPRNFKQPLPNVSVKGIKIFPPTNANPDSALTVEVKILIEASTNVELSPYKVFFACVTSKDRFESFKYSKVVFRNEIKTTADKPNLMKKFLGAGHQAATFPTRYLINKSEELQVMAKEMVVTMSIEKRDFSGFVGCIAVPYAIEENNISLNGLPLGQIEPIALGEPAMERVLIDNVAPIMGSVYTLRDTVAGYGSAGDYWTGAVHNHPSQGYMTGARHSAAPHPRLKKHLVSNQKIKDLRLLKTAQNLDASKLVAQTADINSKIIQVDNQAVKVKFGTSYFSNFHFSRGSNNSAKIYFALDEKRLFADYAKFASLFSNKKSLFSTMEVENITIYRKRVKSADTTNKLTPGAPVDSNTAFYSAREYVGSFGDNAVTYLNLTNLPSNGARDVFVIDNGMVDASAGVYEYTVEVRIVDNSPTALKLVVTKLEEALVAFDAYVGKFNGDGRKNFDTNTYVRMNAQGLKRDDSWKELVNAYISSIMFVFGGKAFGTMSSLSWKKNLLALANPMSADASDVQTLRKIVFDFTSNLKSITEPPSVQGSEEAFSIKTSVDQVSSQRRKNTYSYVIPDKYERIAGAALGFEYLRDEDVIISDGVPVVSYASYATRISAEVSKYKPANASAPGLNTYGFLSPSRVVTPTNTINTIGTLTPLKLSTGSDLLQASLDNPGHPNDFLGATQNAEVQSACIQNILDNSSITVVPLVSSLGVAVNQGAQESTIRNSTNYLNEKSAFNLANDYSVSAASGSTEDMVARKAARAHRDRVLQNPAVTKIISQAGNQFKKPALTNTQAIQGSMAHQVIVSKPGNVLGMNPFQRNINFNSLVKVQYLSGYKKLPGVPGLKELNWQTLTQETYDTARANNLTLLCECVEIESITNTQNLFGLRPYNQLFLMGDSVSTSQPKVANFQTQLQGVQSFTKAQDSQVQVNLSTPAAQVPAQYILSDNATTTGIKNDPGMNGPYGGGMVNLPGKHGPHGGGMVNLPGKHGPHGGGMTGGGMPPGGGGY